MMKPFTVSYDSRSGFDYDESFRTLREAIRYYNTLKSVPFRSLTYDTSEHGTRTLLTSKGENNLRRYGFLPCDYN